MRLLKDLFKKNIISSPIKKGVETACILELANSFIQSITSTKNNNILARAIYCKNTTLTIACKNSIVSQEIMLHENELLSHIKKNTENLTISTIRCVVDQTILNE